jgi:hypothetical protein
LRGGRGYLRNTFNWSLIYMSLHELHMKPEQAREILHLFFNFLYVRAEINEKFENRNFLLAE